MILPDHVLRLVSKEDRERLKLGHTAAETTALAEVKNERLLHKAIEQYCLLHGWICFRSRMDKKTGRPKGEPDFQCLLPEGKILFIECKSATGQLTSEQDEMRRKMESLGHKMHLVRTLQEFINLT